MSALKAPLVSAAFMAVVAFALAYAGVVGNDARDAASIGAARCFAGDGTDARVQIVELVRPLGAPLGHLLPPLADGVARTRLRRVLETLVEHARFPEWSYAHPALALSHDAPACDGDMAMNASAAAAEAVAAAQFKDTVKLRKMLAAGDWINSFILPRWVRASLPLFFASWLRNYIAGNVMYVSVGAAWCAFIYWVRGEKLFPEGRPNDEAITAQMRVGLAAMPLYTMVPSIAEYAMEAERTMAYIDFDEWGVSAQVLFFVLYMCIVEYLIYWFHRLLHDVKPLYRLLHADHHKYNKNNTLSPFAGLAFHPLDGMIQASPYVIAAHLVPMNYYVVFFLLFMTEIWTTSIHDTVDCTVHPIMGAPYHTIHHTAYTKNYGQYFTFCDRAFGSLREPTEDDRNTY